MHNIPHPIENVRQITALAQTHCGVIRGRPLILMDADHTLAPQDASKTFFKVHQWSTDAMINNFDKNGYNHQSFAIHRAIHLPDDPEFSARCERTAEAIELSTGVCSFLESCSKSAYLVVLTGGVAPVWKRVLEKAGFGHIPVHGTVQSGPSLAFSSEGKGAFAKTLAPFAPWSAAIGDSEIESQMMNHSTHGVVVARFCKKRQGLNPQLRQETLGHPRLIQTSHNHLRHDDLIHVPWEFLFPYLSNLNQNCHAA